MRDECRRILIDGTMARGGGGHTYLVNVLPRLTELSARDRFRLLVRSDRLARALPQLENLEVVQLPEASLLERLRFTHRELPKMAKEWGADICFSAGESVPLRSPCPTIASFRNPNVFTDLDQGWGLGQRMRLRLLRAVARLSAATADRIMFVSQDSADWIGRSLGLPESKRAVIHHGIDLAGWGSTAARPVHDRPFALSVSSVYRYKNYVRLIEAWGLLAAEDPSLPDLIIIGDDQDPEYMEQMRAARVALGEHSKRIHILGEVPYEEVRAYYASARLFVFPSYLETFGHPLLEAMACGVPVIAADIPVFRELGRSAALYADPHDPAALATAVRAVLSDATIAETLVERGYERCRQLSWERTARRLLELFEEVGRTASAARTPAAAIHARPISWRLARLSVLLHSLQRPLI